MSNAQDFVTSFMAKLAGTATLTPALQSVFAKILANQVVVADGTVSFKPAFANLSEIFTFIATPAADRPANPLAYTEAQVNAAITAAETETGLTVGEIPTEAPTDEPTDAPTEEPDVEIDGNTVMLTAGVDYVSPNATNAAMQTTDKNDLILGSITDTSGTTAGSGNTEVNTLSPVDSIDGGAGIDELRVSSEVDVADANILPDMQNVEIVTLRVSGDIGKTGTVFDTSIIDDLETLNITRAQDVYVTAGNAVDVKVSGAKGGGTGAGGEIEIDGGQNVTVANAHKNAITIGAADAATGNIKVTDTNGEGAIIVDGGVNVTVSATSKAAGGAITIGATTAATGDVVVNQTTTSDAKAAIQAGNIAVSGGKTITVNTQATNTATKDSLATGGDISGGTIAVTGDENTTSVSVTQAITAKSYDKGLIDGVTETALVTFGALKKGEQVAVGESTPLINGTKGLVFTASKDLTAAQVAAAFANLTVEDTQAEGGKVAHGLFTGKLDAGWTTGAVSGTSVTFTSTKAQTAGLDDIAVDTTTGIESAADFKSEVTQGVAGTPTAKIVTADYGIVTITDGSTGKNTIKTVTVDGYADTSSIVDTTELTTLNLANTDDSGSTITIADTADKLTLNVDKVLGTVVFTESPTNLTLNSAGAASDFKLTETTAAIVDLTINAAAGLTADISGSTNLENLTIKGSAAVDLGDISVATKLKTFDASANTGGVTATIEDDKTKASAGITDYTFSQGNDRVTLNTGNGTVKVSGGAGEDTLVMAAAAAKTASATTTFAGRVTDFERLVLTDASGSEDIDLVNLGNYSHVTVDGPAVTDLTLSKLASNGTLVLSGNDNDTNSGALTVKVTDAATNAAAVLNLEILADQSGDGDVDEHGTLTVANVETINIKTIDGYNDNLAPDVQELILVASHATSINITGDTALDLTSEGSTAVTLIDASSMTGALTAMTKGFANAATIKGGTGNDELTAYNTNDVIYGGAGDDTIIVAASANSVTLYGGTGNDTFDVSAFKASSTGSSVFIADAAAGDIIKFNVGTGTAGVHATFKSSITTVTDESLDAYIKQAATEASSTAAEPGIAWFQFNNATYLVQDNAVTAGYVDNEDVVVKLNGIFDLSEANFNATSGFLELA